MANRAYLYAGDEAGPPGGRDERVLGANYFIPALWLASLAPDGLQHTAAAAPDGNATWHLSVAADEALRRCQGRREALRDCVSNVDDYLPAWLDLLRGLAGRWIKVDPSEVLWMEGTDAEAAASLRAALGFLDAPTPENTAAFLELTCLGDVYDEASHAVRDTPGKVLSEVLEEEDAAALGELAGKRLPGHRAREYLLGYKIAAWVPWPDPDEPAAAPPAKPPPARARVRRLDWHPVSPLACLAAFLWFTRASRWSWLLLLGAAILAAWLALAVYDVASKGKFTAWLERDAP